MSTKFTRRTAWAIVQNYATSRRQTIERCSHLLFVRFGVIRPITLLLYAAFVIFPASSAAQGIGITSARVIGPARDRAELEIIIDNDGSKGKIRPRVVAKSRNGVWKSYDEAMSNYLPVGHDVIGRSVALRPPIYSDVRTDVLVIELFQDDNVVPIYRKKIDCAIHWEPLANDGSAPGSLQVTIPVNEATRLDTYVSAFRDNFLDDEMSSIDEIIDDLNASRALDETGEWLLARFPHALELAFRNDSNVNISRRLKQWQQKNPASIGAYAAEALYLREKAWRIRGGAFKRHVSPLALKLFNEQMQAALAILDKVKPHSLDNALWHHVYLLTANESGMSESVVREAFADAVRRFPNNRALYSAMAFRYAPPYGVADWSKVKEVVELAVNNTKHEEGQSNYAAIYHGVIWMQPLELSPFDQGIIDWQRMKRGYLDLIKRHPYPGFKNNFAEYACRAKDRESFEHALSLIGDDFMSSEWPANHSLDVCKGELLRRRQGSLDS